MLRPILFTLILAAPAARAKILSPEVEAAVRHFRDLEALGEPTAGHESVVRLHVDAAGRPVETARAALIISGLFNSPRAMRALEDFYFERGLNVINLRLAGHYEKDPSILRGSVKWERWREQSIEAFALAGRLGRGVTLVGHSTGALLVTWLAVERPRAATGLALFAPAFELSPALSRVLAVNHELHVTMPRGRQLTLYAGREVEKLGRAFRDAMDRHGDGLGYVAKRLAPIPLWMANTGFDTIIDLAAAERFFAAVDRDGAAERHHRRLSACNFILHDQIASPSSWRWRALRKSMARTLFAE